MALESYAGLTRGNILEIFAHTGRNPHDYREASFQELVDVLEETPVVILTQAWHNFFSFQRYLSTYPDHGRGLQAGLSGYIANRRFHDEHQEFVPPSWLE